ncbi:NAD nucleotidase [Neptunomonas marina]|nr:NAD nucleotidase [Neptunomonas marina]
MPHFTMFKKAAFAVAVTTALAGCNDSNNDSQATSELTLKILHINDHHSHLRGNSGDIEIAGASTDVKMGGFAKVVQKMNDLQAGATNVLKLHAGDAITGDLYYTLFKGEADAAMMNQVCFDAFALGNHEFDDGDAGLKAFLDHLNSGACNTDVLAANVIPEVGVSPLAQSSATDYFKPYTIKTFGDQKVGIIGIDIASKTKNSSSPDATTQFLDETSTAQRYIDELSAMGIDNIILMTHYQYKNDLKLAQSLTGVDLIVGGDSHTLLGDQFTALGLNSTGPYPTQLTNKSGEPVCIVQAWEYSNVVGELDITLQDGKVKSCSGTPHLLLADTFERDDTELAGTERQAVLDAIAANDVLSVVMDDPTAANVLAGYSDQVDSLKQAVIGSSTDDLCLERIPGQGKSALCDATATQSNGSDISNIVAKAFRTMSLTSDIAIQNGGGVRVDIPQGDITVGDAYTLLPFANTLVELTMTGAQIKAVLEDAFDYAISPDGSTGAYPYAAGLRWDVDRSQTKGMRFSNLEVMRKGTSTWSALDLNASYKVVTNNYIAGGRDGYLTFGVISAEEGKVVDTFLDYAQSFVDYVEAEGSISKLPLSEYSTQKYYDENGVLQ